MGKKGNAVSGAKQLGINEKFLRTFNGDQNTTAASQNFFEDPMDPEDERSEEDLSGLHQMMNQSQVPNDFSEPMLEKFMRSQALSHYSEMQLDKAVNRLFEDAGRKKMKLEKLRMENMLTQLSSTKTAPSINSHSRQLVQMKDRVPIHKRNHQAEAQKEKRRQNVEQQVKEREEKEQAELTFKPKINKNSQRMASFSGQRSSSFLEREKNFMAKKISDREFKL